MLQKAQEKGRIFISDCEGPISKDDNAFELTKFFVPHGDRLFALVSKYDDILADVFRRPKYKAGDTLKLILPFLKAYGATDNKMRDFSAKHVTLVKDAKVTLKFIQKIMPSFIINTSYEHYTYALCDHLDFPHGNAIGTKLKIDSYEIDENEKQVLKQIVKKIVRMAMIQIPKNASCLQDFSKTDQETVKQLDMIFWEEIDQMKSGRMLKEVNPIGGREKANEVKAIIEKHNSSLDNAIYIGDSITDVAALQLVRENGGLAVSFNGNEYAIREAEIAVLAETTLVTAIIADVFHKFGKDRVLQLAQEWSPIALKEFDLAPLLQENLLKMYPTKLPKMTPLTFENRQKLAEESKTFRKLVRGEAIGKLG